MNFGAGVAAGPGGHAAMRREVLAYTDPCRPAKLGRVLCGGDHAHAGNR